jgi:hypothetical protein
MFVLNRYFVQMADVIERNGDHVEKFIGDAIMAIFGMDDTPDFPLRAVKGATEMPSSADRMKSYMKAMYDMDFEVGIGLHHGDAVIGTVSGWCPLLQPDGTPKGAEYLVDVSKPRAPIKPLPCLVRDGFLWVAPG